MTYGGGKLGRVEVAPSAIATLVAEAVKECYGVVDMSGRGFLEGLAGTLHRGGPRGIDVQVTGEHVVVDIWVVVEYGLRITEVADGIMRRVHFTLEQTLGLTVDAVNVHVQGLRVSDSNAALE
jgi:uncharacterized alkaline shock family protein YloU